MAGADYRHCDVCQTKCFYDANLNYEEGPPRYRPDAPPYRVVGAEQEYSTEAHLKKYGLRLDYLGDWAVICSDCAKTHKTVIAPIAASDAAHGDAKED